MNSAPPTHGAFLTFREDNLVPGIHWFTNTHDNQLLDDQRIAAVLGGCYASSRNYWNYIDGFDGLLDYGCEEAYVSFKSWLNGAGCRIIPEIQIGHIYRSTPKFKIQKASYIYNYLIISEILFPTNEQSNFLSSMKIERRLSDLVTSNFTELTHDEQGMVKGGFGSIIPGHGGISPQVKDNCSCANKGCPCTGNNCDCGLTTAAPTGNGTGFLTI